MSDNVTKTCGHAPGKRCATCGCPQETPAPTLTSCPKHGGAHLLDVVSTDLTRCFHCGTCFVWVPQSVATNGAT